MTTSSSETPLSTDERNFSVKTKRTDTELLDGLEKLVNRGDCPGVINDDAGRWAVSGSGMQNMPDNDEPIDIQTTFFIEAKDWRPTIREAIEAYLDADETESHE